MRLASRKKGLIILLIIVVLTTLWWSYIRYVAPTRIAVVAFPGFMMEKMERANNNKWIKIEQLSLEEFDKLDNYPLALIRGHGIRISPEQLESISEASVSGTKIYVADVTNPEYDLTNITGKELDYFTNLLENKGSKNFSSLFNYAREEIDRKSFFLEPYEDAVIIPDNYLFHLEQDMFFSNVKEYEEYYKKIGKYKEGKPRVALLAGNINMQNSNAEHTVKLIEGLEKKDLNVYPIHSFGSQKLEFLESCYPDIVILRPHGRFAIGQKDKAIEWLKKRNIPVLAPVTVFGEYEKWLKDPQGMYGGMLSMSVVMPELDGAVAPYAIVAQFKNKAGNLIFDGIDNRIDDFCELTANWLKLKNIENKDKKVAIYYFKGPGKNALVAAGLEVIPSLYNTLERLKEEGYNLQGLPETKDEFERILMQKGPVLGPYAEGAFDHYLKNGEPILIEKQEYMDWCKKALPNELYQAVVEKYGEAPGHYMSVEKNGKQYIAVTCVRFGNICLLPQPLPGIGEDEQQLVHGAESAPPHTYIASYLYTRFGFKTDAIFHFGTHGSLEFTPGKQVALSDYDWSDRLIGTTPHFYNYTISNIGEGIIAKRRSYATLLTHITPPFMQSDLHDDFGKLQEKIDKYNSLEEGPVREQYALSAKELAEKLNVHKSLGLDSIKKYTAVEIHKIHEYLEEVEQEKVTAGLYTLGIPYIENKLLETSLLMSIDPIAFSMAELDVMRGKIASTQFQDAIYVSENYKSKAKQLAMKAIKGEAPSGIIESLITKEELNLAEKWNKENSNEDLLALMMSKVPKSNAKKQAVDTEKLPDLIIKLCSEERNMKYIEELKSDKVFAKASKMTNEASRARSLKMADKLKDVAPMMFIKVQIANQPDMLELLKLMQDSALRMKTFELLEDKNLAQRIEKEKVELLKKRAIKCDEAEISQWLKLAFDESKEEHINQLQIEKIKEALDGIDFISNNTACFQYCKNIKYAEYFRKSEKWNLQMAETDSLLKQSLAKKEEFNANYAKAINKLKGTIENARTYKENLYLSSKRELESILNSLNGGYTAPSSGGDPIVNPSALPTGRNMYAVDAERTPSEEAWKVGKRLAESLLEKEKELKEHYPKKISFTLWSTNFISTEGATIAQILYLLGVEPVRDGFGTVRNIRLIPMSKLNRPRIDVVIQTSGQLRDIAASRLDLINRAIELAANANDSEDKNFVKSGLVDAEKFLLEKGFSPLDARKFSSKRIFGGVNGNYGTGIMGLVEKGDAWEQEEQIAKQYLNNMGAIYEKGEDWGTYREGIFEAALQNTETVVQPRSSNTWGPLSLDHVYEFMGGINLTVRNVTGEDPSAYFNDFRNVSRPKMQGLKEAIGVETNSTVFNPKFINEMLAGEASSMETFAERFRNTYGWNVMKPEAIDDYIWDNYFEIYVQDKFKLGVHERFETENPYALQEMTSIMLETARKGYWKANEIQLKETAKLHAELVKKHDAGCSGFVCDNFKLKQFIAENLSEQLSAEYKKAIDEVRNVTSAENKKNVVLKKEEEQEQEENNSSSKKPEEDQEADYLWFIIVGGVLLFVVFFLRKRSN